MKKVILLGSTGSIGRNAIKVIQALKGFGIVGLASYSNYRMLASQARALRPKVITIIDTEQYKELKRLISGIKILCGEEGINEMIENTRADMLVCAFASALGISGIIKAIEKRMRICLATKEILVSFGDIIMNLVKKKGVELLPIDSEHSAIHQCLEGKSRDTVKSIILTASGGPFLNKSINNVKKIDVLRHPVWQMGVKITVDSATMMNKGLEVIEAHHLFNLSADAIKVVVHPEALCHSLVQFADGTLLAQLSSPDMKLPIQYALTAPRRTPSLVKYLEIDKVKKLTFLPPDFRKFPCLKCAYDALKIGKSMPAVLNAANEELVKLFLEDKVKFNEIATTLKSVMNRHKPKKGNINLYLEYAKWSKEMVRSLVC